MCIPCISYTQACPSILETLSAACRAQVRAEHFKAPVEGRQSPRRDQAWSMPKKGAGPAVPVLGQLGRSASRSSTSTRGRSRWTWPWSSSVDIPGSWFGGGLAASEKKEKYTAQAVEFAEAHEFKKAESEGGESDESDDSDDSDDDDADADADADTTA